MRTLYLECNMGASGDMLTGALLELLPDPEAFLERFRGLGLPGVTLERERSVKCGIVGTHARVRIRGVEEESVDAEEFHTHREMGHSHEHLHAGGEAGHDHEHSHAGEEAGSHHEHTHTSMDDIEHMIRELPVPEKVREHAVAVYRLIAGAESRVHGVPVEQIHFHEVGTMDAVADVTAVCMLLEELAPDRIVSSPVHVGSGQVRCAHGILPVPAPAVTELLRGVPVYGGQIQGELCTPTGAALLRHFAGEFGGMPPMRIDRVGYGMGQKDFPAANCLRAILGEQEQPMEDVLELCCNLDDMTPEDMGFVTDLLMREGALDVYVTPVQMKKNRPGWVLTCMCPREDKDRFLRLMFRHTTTLGVREYVCRRYGLERSVQVRQTPWGEVRVKQSRGYGVDREKAEYEDLAGIARERGISLGEARRVVEAAEHGEA